MTDTSRFFRQRSTQFQPSKAQRLRRYAAQMASFRPSMSCAWTKVCRHFLDEQNLKVVGMSSCHADCG